MLTQSLTEDPRTGEIRLRNTLDLKDLMEANAYARQTDGYTKKRLGRRLFSAPYHLLANDPDGQMYLASDPTSPERRIAAIRLMIKYPIKTCSGNV